MQYSFDIDIATQYDVNVAIFLNNMAFWTKKNQANEQHYYDGSYWTYNTLEAFHELFPFWTTKQLRIVIDKCLSEGLLIKGNYNETKYHRRLWYALTEKGLELFKLPICPKGQIKLPKRANQVAQKGKYTITDINTDIKPEQEKSAPRKRRALICDSFYPNQENQKLCDKTATKCGVTGMYIIKKFIDVQKRYSTQSDDFNVNFKEFLLRELPSRKSGENSSAKNAASYLNRD